MQQCRTARHCTGHHIPRRNERHSPIVNASQYAIAHDVGPGYEWSLEVQGDHRLQPRERQLLRSSGHDAQYGSAVSTASTPLPASLPSGMVAWWPADGYPTDIVG